MDTLKHLEDAVKDMQTATAVICKDFSTRVGILRGEAERFRALSASLAEREASVEKREKAVESKVANISAQLSEARVAKKAAEDREDKLAEKFAELRKKYNAKCEELATARRTVAVLAAETVLKKG